jgi:dihydroorotate dehydrogenase
MIERAGLALLRRVDPERAHGLALGALRMGLGPREGPATSDRLATRVGETALPNPVGLAAGFDKDATALDGLARCAFGFLEVGAVTPRPQPGNPRPRLFRLPEDRAAINRFGFNNAGMHAAAERLARRPAGAVIGVNLGANKDSPDRAADFAAVLRVCGPHVDFATVNVSSPNTEALRDLQGADALRAVLAGVMEANAGAARPVPVWLKIAPDLEPPEIEAIARAAEEAGVAAIVATNTTLARDALRSRHAQEKGGLSGAPLFAPSTRILARLSTLTGLPLVGVGGIASAGDAYAKIRAGASAVQIYTALAYEGPSLAARIAQGLNGLLARDGLTLAEARGADRNQWL